MTNFILKKFEVSYASHEITDSLKWNFDNFKDNYSNNTSETLKAKLEYAEPLASASYNWSIKDTILFPSTRAKFFDEVNSKLCVLCDQQLISYSLVDKRKDIISFSGDLPFTDGTLLKNHLTNEYLFINSGGSSEVSRFNPNIPLWSKINSNKSSTDYFSAAYFINASDSRLYSWGGYGNYKFKDKLQKYNWQDKSWQFVTTFGDTIEPRKPNYTKTSNDSLFYIGGGIGSEIGDQRYKTISFSDIYSLNLNNSRIKKIADLIDLKYNQIINDFIFVPIEKAVYFTVVTEEKNQNDFQLYKYLLEENKCYSVGEKLTFNSPFDLAKFYYSQKTNEIIAVREIKNKTDYVAYSLLIPAINKKELDRIIFEQQAENKSLTYFLIISFGIIVLIIWFYLKKKKSKKYYPAKENNKNSLFLLGEFRFYNKKSENIESRFTIKTLEAFLLILLNSIKSNNHSTNSGISSADLGITLWPDFEKDNQKNSRNVTINKIRHILEDVDGIQIVYQHNRWLVKIHNDFFVDAIAFFSILNKMSKEDLFDFINQFPVSEFCKGISYDWLDPI